MQRKTQNMKRNAGFTLVEMLVVIVIILVLMGVVFKMTRPSASKQAEAETVAKLERLKAALEEFYAEYGQYPPVPYYKNVYQRLDNSAPKDAPVQPLGYEFPWKDGMRSDMTGKFRDQTWDSAPIYTFGLMSFLLPRYAGRAGDGWSTLLDNGQWRDYNDQKGDLARDARACARWAPFLDGIITPDTPPRGLGNDAYTNSSHTVWDSWERDLVYVSPPPHQSYLLFSKGPDGKYDYTNPNNRDSPDNKDNIYGDVGFVQR
jgi:prepilin-type N-terminal cleavage/methylation domain-containing protein